MSPKCIKSANLKKYKEEMMDYIPTGQISYYVDQSVAPVIEYTPSRIRQNGEISQGRIWAQMAYVESNQWVGKSNEYKKSFEKIVPGFVRILSEFEMPMVTLVLKLLSYKKTEDF